MLYQSPGASTFESPPPLSDMSTSTEHAARRNNVHDGDATPQQSRRMRNQLEDHSQMFGGSHWFAGGSVPDTHVVGKAVPAAGGRPNPAAAPHHTSSSNPASAHYHDFSSYLFEQREESQQSHRQQAGTPTPQRRTPQESPVSGSTPYRQGKVLPSPLTAPRIHATPSHRTSHADPSSSRTAREHSPQRLGLHGQWERDGEVAGSTEYHSGEVAHRGGHDSSRGVTRWDASGRVMYDVDVRPSTSNMSTGVPRGYGGLDTIPAAARQAQRNIEDMQQDVARIRKLELQRKLREDLDQQIREKQQRKLKEWEAEVITVYGPAMVLDDSRRTISKANHHSLQGVWKAQAAEAARRKAEEDAYYKPYEENWSDLKSDMDRMRHDDVGKKLQRRQNSWLEAWKDQQAAEGDMKKAAASERHRQEQLSIAPHIANYSDRILLAEQQKREAHAAYHNALQEQVSDRNRRKYEALADEYANDPGVNSYHRGPVQRSWDQDLQQRQRNVTRRV
jgi:hypothetical protein